MITLKPSTTLFMHNKVKHMSLYVMAYRGNECLNAFRSDTYVDSDDMIFEAAMTLRNIAASIKGLLESIGTDAEVGPDLQDAIVCSKYLKEAYSKCL